MGPWLRIWLGVAALTALSLGATARGEPKADRKAKRSPERVRYVVAAMGDSLTDPRSHGGKYLEYLQKMCPESRFDSYGIGGNMVNQMRRRFARDVLGEHEGRKIPKPEYSHVIVLGGINDICSDETAERKNDKIQRDLGKMYEMARSRGMEVVALTLPPWGGFKRYYNRRRAASTFALNRWLKEQKKRDRVDVLVDIFPMLSCGDRELLCPDYGWPDQVHWSKKGHLVVGKALHRQVFADCR